jgi:hypothetical protein
MATAENPLGDAGKIDFDAICSDVDEHYLEAARPRVRHHLEVMLPR